MSRANAFMGGGLSFELPLPRPRVSFLLAWLEQQGEKVDFVAFLESSEEDVEVEAELGPPVNQLSEE
eukprot:4009766-Amphidinium_carterae.2